MHKIEKLFLTAIVVVGLAIGFIVSASTAYGQRGPFTTADRLILDRYNQFRSRR